MQYPEMRDELLLYVQELSDIEYQKKNWLHPSPERIEGIASVADEMFGNTGLLDDPQGAVNVFIYANELSLVKSLMDVLNTVVDEIKHPYDSEGAINHRLWPDVLERARQLRDKMTENDSLR